MSLAHSAIFVSPTSWWMHPPPLKNGDKEKGAGELTLDVSAPSKEIWQTDAISQSVHHVHRNLFYLAATKIRRHLIDMPFRSCHILDFLLLNCLLHIYISVLRYGTLKSGFWLRKVLS